MDFFASNSRFIDGGAIKDLPPSPPVERAKNGGPVIKIGGISLASYIDPEAEGEKFARAADIARHPNLLVYGIGLGYHLESLLRLLPPGGRLAAIEANGEILSAALNNRDLSAILSDPRFTLVAGSGDSEICRALYAVLGDAEWHVLIHPASFRLVPETYPALKRMFEMIRADRRFTGSFGARERENIIANIPAIAASPGVSSLFGALRGKPAVLVGSGPSLDRALPFLDRLSGKAFIMAVDTSAEALQAQGIAFDMVMSVDPQPDSASYGFGYSAPLVFLPSTHPAVVGRFKGRRFLMVKDSHAVFKNAQFLLEGRGVSTAGGSVSCVALDLLVQTGANPIGLVGQDFAFPKGMPYNRHTMGEYGEAPFAGMAGEGTAEFLVRRVEPLTIDTVRGAGGLTHANLFGYLRTFEAIIAANPQAAFYNICSDGAAIRGCGDVLSLVEAERIFGGGAAWRVDVPAESPSPELEEKLKALLLEQE